MDRQTVTPPERATAPTNELESTGRICAWCPMYIDDIAERTHEQIAAVLRDVVAVNGSQKEAARVLGISPQYLCDLLKGRREISAEMAEVLQFRRVVVYVDRYSKPVSPSARELGCVSEVPTFPDGGNKK